MHVHNIYIYTYILVVKYRSEVLRACCMGVWLKTMTKDKKEAEKGEWRGRPQRNGWEHDSRPWQRIKGKLRRGRRKEEVEMGRSREDGVNYLSYQRITKYLLWYACTVAWQYSPHTDCLLNIPYKPPKLEVRKGDHKQAINTLFIKTMCFSPNQLIQNKPIEVRDTLPNPD